MFYLTLGTKEAQIQKKLGNNTRGGVKSQIELAQLKLVQPIDEENGSSPKKIPQFSHLNHQSTSLNFF
jgi:hypothetical protein